MLLRFAIFHQRSCLAAVHLPVKWFWYGQIQQYTFKKKYVTFVRCPCTVFVVVGFRCWIRATTFSCSKNSLRGPPKSIFHFCSNHSTRKLSSNFASAIYNLSLENDTHPFVSFLRSPMYRENVFLGLMWLRVVPHHTGTISQRILIHGSAHAGLQTRRHRRRRVWWCFSPSWCNRCVVCQTTCSNLSSHCAILSSLSSSF